MLVAGCERCKSFAGHAVQQVLRLAACACLCAATIVVCRRLIAQHGLVSWCGHADCWLQCIAALRAAELLGLHQLPRARWATGSSIAKEDAASDCSFWRHSRCLQVQQSVLPPLLLPLRLSSPSATNQRQQDKRSACALLVTARRYFKRGTACCSVLLCGCVLVISACATPVRRLQLPFLAPPAVAAACLRLLLRTANGCAAQLLARQSVMSPSLAAVRALCLSWCPSPCAHQPSIDFDCSVDVCRAMPPAAARCV